MKVVIPKETEAFEKRVAATPETVKKMIAAGLEVAVESGAGTESLFSDSDYRDAGASVASDLALLYRDAAILLKVQKPEKKELDLYPDNAIVIGLLQTRFYPDLVEHFNRKKNTAFSLEGIPRIARAQKLDALSSQSNVAGYKAVLMAADRLKKMMPLMMTAAGTITPARVLVLGAGVAGLQAVATARRLGAVVEAFDTRPVVKEQVESLGGKFLQIDVGQEKTEDAGGYAKELSEETHRKEMALIAKHAKEADIIITTALIPGKTAPLLITEEAVKSMKAGSVIVDLAAETGGNCAVTEKGKEIVKHGVTIVGLLNIPSLAPFHASQLYARNVLNFLFEIYKKGKLSIDLGDEVVQGALATDPNHIPAGTKAGA